jgi:zinc-ribbon domain
VFCPRCGTENAPGDRYCSNCGATLKERTGPRERLSLRQRLGRLIGTTRRARIITGGTALAIVIAIVAVVALPSNETEIPRDSYTISADRMCVAAKKQIGAASSRALANAQKGDPGDYARSLVPIIAQWRIDFDALHAPADRAPQAVALDSALLEVEIKAAGLALAADRGAPDLVARAQQVDHQTQAVEGAINDLGLRDCADITIAPGAPPPS